MEKLIKQITNAESFVCTHNEEELGMDTTVCEYRPLGDVYDKSVEAHSINFIHPSNVNTGVFSHFRVHYSAPPLCKMWKDILAH